MMRRHHVRTKKTQGKFVTCERIPTPGTVPTAQVLYSGLRARGALVAQESIQGKTSWMRTDNRCIMPDVNNKKFDRRLLWRPD
jgi:hypothetical protein